MPIACQVKLPGANSPGMCAIDIGLFPPAMRAELTAIGQGSYRAAVIAPIAWGLRAGSAFPVNS